MGWIPIEKPDEKPGRTIVDRNDEQESSAWRQHLDDAFPDRLKIGDVLQDVEGRDQIERTFEGTLRRTGHRKARIGNGGCGPSDGERAGIEPVTIPAGPESGKEHSERTADLEDAGRVRHTPHGSLRKIPVELDLARRIVKVVVAVVGAEVGFLEIPLRRGRVRNPP